MAMNEEALTELIELLSIWHAKYYKELGDIMVSIDHSSGVTVLDITSKKLLTNDEVIELFSSIH